MDNKICKKHNQPALFCQQDAQQNLILLCNICIQQRLNIQNIDDVENKQKQVLQQLESKYDQKIIQLKDFAELLQQYTQQVQQKLQKLKLNVDQNIQHLIEKKNQLKNISKVVMNFQQNQINEQENIMNNQLTQIKQQLNQQLKDIEINIKLDQLYKSLDSLLIDENNKVNDNNYVKKITKIDKKFDFQLIQQLPYKKNEWCRAIAFNKNSSIMIAGCDKLIKVFEFKNDKLTEVQQLNGHKDDVYCLLFMIKSNQFISGSRDSTIKIWKQSQNYQWQSNQVLQGHTSYIYCITMNQNEDILISGSHDKTIKFWNLQNKIWSSNQSIDCQSCVYSISLNNKEDQLISSVETNKILIIQLQDKQWIIKQKITVEQFGYRLCYINSDQFVFQPYDRQHLQIFDYDPKDQIFKKAQELQYSNKESDYHCLFPIRYITQIELIMVKNDQHVHLIKRSQNGQFTVEQSINFNTNGLYGGISDDGRYIATWDNKSKEIQIRKFEY